MAGDDGALGPQQLSGGDALCGDRAQDPEASRHRVVDLLWRGRHVHHEPATWHPVEEGELEGDVVCQSKRIPHLREEGGNTALDQHVGTVHVIP